MSLDLVIFEVKVVDDLHSASIRRVYLSNDTIKAANIATGDLLSLRAAEGDAFAVGVAWPMSTLQNNYVQISSTLAATAMLIDGVKAQLATISSVASSSGMTPPEIKAASKLICTPISNLASSKNPERKGWSRESATSSKRKRLDAYVKEALIDVKYVTPYQALIMEYHGTPHHLRISWPDEPDALSALENKLNGLSIQSPRQLSSIRLVDWDTNVVLVGSPTSDPPDTRSSDPVTAHSISTTSVENVIAEHAYTSVGGLDRQIAEIRNLIELPLQRPDLFLRFGLKPPKGVLLHGPPGTGKTRLAHAIATSTKSSLILIHGPELSSAYHGETEAALRQIFERAKKESPCVIVLDELDALCPRREEGSGEVEKRVVATLLTLMDGMTGDREGASVIVVGTTNRVNAIDPALRRPGRFDREVEIGIPDVAARLAILRVLLEKLPHSLDDAALQALAGRTHGYVGADLAALVRDAGALAIHRWLDASKPSATSSDRTAELTLSDLSDALPGIRPSAMREVFIETPSVRWSDVGGQQLVKEKLKECVEWPLLHPETFERLGVAPPKGVLLYGPPGCSKTLTAKALATESGINFLAVKGPELLNKFVGESERAIREIFRKARAAAPSIIFFDEIDALGSSRASTDSGGSSHEGMLTTLLNEMDGIQELVGVTIVAATNRPDVIDSALMRPGRLDRILYVGPPDLDARLEILKIRTAKMAVEPGLDLHDLALKVCPTLRTGVFNSNEIHADCGLLRSRNRWALSGCGPRSNEGKYPSAIRWNQAFQGSCEQGKKGYNSRDGGKI
ncbi:AAA-domain-containing protein [Calocera viscosa TUFC12733]|uniref:AAA-domain-containing protein n=1 Tax=Calocera viscosa (strain TUFC12733) TaxID=1330018 RepID=A0A167HGW7_CALVF|nr:AAA-domain-containing protein [Calocera viscosa TUFC12733]